MDRVAGAGPPVAVGPGSWCYLLLQGRKPTLCKLDTSCLFLRDDSLLEKPSLARPSLGRKERAC